MSPPIAPDPRARVEEFRRKHRIGLVALLFTDIVGSTKLKQVLGDHQAISLIQRHHEIVREILSGFSEGQEIETAGDSFFLVFAKPSDAVKFSLLLQSNLRTLDKERTILVSDRIGIHVGEVFIGEEEKADSSKHLYGIQVDTCARVMSLAQGDQILMTRFAFDNARQVLRGEELPGINELSWLNHGPYLVKGLEEAIEICEVGEAGRASLKAPSDIQRAQRQISPDTEPVLGWRPALEQGVPGTEWILEKKLGEGGFGEVWLGRHEKLKDRRVFKFCFRADRVRSLKREVTLFRVLKERVGQHPNIVGVQEVYFNEPPFYIVMDYAEATDLRAWCEKEGFENISVARRLEIVAQVADGLHAAHEAGVIHRDVKPSNILVSGNERILECGGSTPLSISDASGLSPPATGERSQNVVKASHAKVQAKLTDFGIGQVVSQEALAGMTKMGFTQTMLSPGSSSQTGTHLYMAPELLAGKPASTRSDIYSLGVVLYQLLIGDFSRPLTTDWARRITDPLLREDLEKCFAGDPEERYVSAGELATNLRALEKRQCEVTQRQAALAARETASRRRSRLQQTAVALSLVLAMAAILFYAFKQTRSAPPRTKPIVVLPFKNDSPDKADEYLSDSLTGEFINRLKKVRGLKPFRVPQSMATNRLDVVRMWLINVPTIFVGNVQKTGAQLRMTVRLVNTADLQPLWTNSYPLNTNGALTLSGDLVGDITTALEIPLTAAEREQIKTTPTQIPEAYDAYLRGKFHSRFTLEANNRLAIEMLEQAVKLDTNFALAYAELGRVYANRLAGLKPNEKEWEVKAKRVIDKALSLNTNLAEAHFSSANLLWTPSQQFQHEPAIRELLIALHLDPQSEDAYWLLNMVYGHVGLYDECKWLSDRAIQDNPLEPRGYWTRGLAFMSQGQYSLALETWGNARGDHWIPPLGDWLRAWSHFQLGETNETRAIIDDFLKKRPDDYGGLFGSLRAMLYAKAGDTNKAELEIVMAQQGKAFVHFHHTTYQIAAAYALMNNPDKAIHWFKKTVADGFNSYPFFRDDHNLDSLKRNQKFEDLMAKEKEKYDYYKTNFGIGSLAWGPLQRDRK